MVSLQVEARRRDKFQHEYSIQARAWALVNPRPSQHLNEKCCSMFQDALTGSTLVSFYEYSPVKMEACRSTASNNYSVSPEVFVEVKFRSPRSAL